MHLMLVRAAAHMFSWGWRKLDLIGASAPLLEPGARITRHTIRARACAPAGSDARCGCTHIFLGDFGSGVLVFGRLEAIHAELLVARLNLPGVSRCCESAPVRVWMSAFMWRRADLQTIASHYRRVRKSRRLITHGVSLRNTDAETAVSDNR